MKIIDFDEHSMFFGKFDEKRMTGLGRGTALHCSLERLPELYIAWCMALPLVRKFCSACRREPAGVLPGGRELLVELSAFGGPPRGSAAHS